MTRRALVIVAALLFSGCGPQNRDSVSADRCATDPVASVPSVPAAELPRHLAAAHEVVAGRVRFTGMVTRAEAGTRTDFRYVIVDTDEFLRGDPWQVAPRYRRSFPLLAPLGPEPSSTPLDALECRQGESFLFFVDLPPHGPALDAERTPGPVQRAFGPERVALVAIAPASEREQVLAAIAASH